MLLCLKPVNKVVQWSVMDVMQCHVKTFMGKKGVAGSTILVLCKVARQVALDRFEVSGS